MRKSSFRMVSRAATLSLCLGTSVFLSSCSPTGKSTQSSAAKSIASLASLGRSKLHSLLLGGSSSNAVSSSPLHYAAGGNLDSSGAYAPGAAGFNLADVSSVSELNALPAGVQGLVYLGMCNGADSAFVNAVQSFAGNSKLFGFYLVDEPDPTGQYNTLCSADNLLAESDYIHANLPGAKSFIVLMDMGSFDSPSFDSTYSVDNTHIDLFGLDPYPCRSTLNGCDYSLIDRTVAAAQSWGIPTSAIVPVFQTFGGGAWSDNLGGSYLLPSADQENQILARWASLIPSPAFEMAYSWGPQNGDSALSGSPELQAVFSAHNSGSVSPEPVPSPSSAPDPSTSPTTDPSTPPTAPPVSAAIDIPPTGTTAFDIQATSAVSGFSADNTGASFDWGNMNSGASLQYPLFVEQANNYVLDISAATPLDGAGVKVLANGSQVKLIAVPNTGDWGAYTDVTAAIFLPQGNVTFVIQDSNGVSINIQGISLTLLTSTAPSPTPTSPAPSPTSDPSPAPMPSPIPLPPPPPSGQNAHFDHVLLVVLENTGFSEVMANPTFAQFAKQGALLSNFSAVAHPSEPNYLAMTAGTDFGLTDDNFRTIDAKNIADLLEAKGLSWKSYNDAYPGGCPFGNSGTFDYNHSPLLNFADIRNNASRCASHIVDASQLQVDLQNGTLPNYMFYTPDVNNDGHDTNVAYSANWFNNTIVPLLNNPTFMNGTLVVVYYDEDDGGGNNQIYMAMQGSMVAAGSSVGTAYNHYSLLRTIEDNFGLGTLGQNDATASAIQGIWK